MSAESTPPVEALCLACGACCDGTLFTHAELEAGEDQRLQRRLRLLPQTGGAKASFAQPCAAHGPGGCGAYVDRPAVCSRYRCDLYKACEAGRVTKESAVAQVGRIRALAARVREKLGADGSSRSLWQRVAGLPEASAHELAARDAELAMDIAELALRIKRDLGVAPDGKLPDSSA